MSEIDDLKRRAGIVNENENQHNETMKLSYELMLLYRSWIIKNMPREDLIQLYREMNRRGLDHDAITDAMEKLVSETST